MKKVSISTKPLRTPADADQWVKDRTPQPAEPIKRLTLDVPAALHQRVKIQCASEGVFIADVIRDFLEKRFGQEYAGRGPTDDAPAT
jgi:hypothetical protein